MFRPDHAWSGGRLSEEWTAKKERRFQIHPWTQPLDVLNRRKGRQASGMYGCGQHWYWADKSPPLLWSSLLETIIEMAAHLQAQQTGDSWHTCFKVDSVHWENSPCHQFRNVWVEQGLEISQISSSGRRRWQPSCARYSGSQQTTLWGSSGSWTWSSFYTDPVKHVRGGVKNQVEQRHHYVNKLWTNGWMCCVVMCKKLETIILRWPDSGLGLQKSTV